MREEKTLRPVIPNAGIEATYRKKLKRLIAEMQASITYWLEQRYRASMAQDATPADDLQRTMTHLAEQWQARFDEGAQRLADWFAQKTKNYADGTLQGILKDSGFAVKFTMTEPMENAYSAVIHEQVGLIKSIASEHLQEVQGLVMRSVQQGRTLGELSQELEKRYGITKRRAALIARDQNNKATAVLTRTRHQQLGITQAKWRHSHAGKHPRPSHVAFDGKTYDIDKGAYIDGEWILPGELINCRCTARPVLPGIDY